MSDGMTDDDRRWLERRVAQFPPATYASNIESALLAEAARTDDLAARLDALEARLADRPAPSGSPAPQRWPDEDWPEWWVYTARCFHRAYEDLAPEHGYKTRDDSAVPFDKVPEPNRSLMVRTAGGVLRSLMDKGWQPPAPERFVCSDGVTREPTGAVRPPQVGEWYLAGNGHPLQAASFHRNRSEPCRILRPVQDAAPDWESRARSAEAEVARLRDGIEREVAWAPLVSASSLRALLDPPGADQ